MPPLPRTRPPTIDAPPSGPAPAAAAPPASRAAPPDPREPDDELDREDDDSGLELPPLDAEEEGEEDDHGDLADLIAPLDDEDSLDDAAAGELETGEDVDLEDRGALGEDEPAEDAIDVGALHEEIDLADREGWTDEDAEGAGDHEDVVDDDGRADEDDGGAEGTGEDPGADVDEAALPALDADDEGTYEGEDLLAELPEVPDDRPPAWDAAPWALVEGAGAAAPCGALAVSGGRVAAGGRARGGERGVVLLVDPGASAARRAGFEAAAASVAISDGAIVVATRRGHLLRSDDGGATTSALGAWGQGTAAPVTLATTPGRLWILSEGTLWSLPVAAAVQARGLLADEPRVSLEPAAHAVVARDRDVLRVAASGGTLVALTSGSGGPRIERLRGDDEGAPSVPLEGAAREAAQAEGGQLAAAAGGQGIALSGDGALFVSRDGGATFRALGGLSRVLALAFAGDDEAAPLLALVTREGEAGAQVVHVPASGAATVVAEVGAGAGGAGAGEEPESSGPAAIAWDASREVAWIACPAGLLALARARTH
ncbi:MAG: hypothetical protein IT372_42360 [Polyangiaceae bacterium]|nr:hypothetical protein [Polyangiaceae bacterium]